MECESKSGTHEEQFLRKVEDRGKAERGVLCKCGEGWTCVISRSVGPEAGKVFAKCGENTTCTISSDGEVVKQEEESKVGSEAYCKCGEGWSCVISKIEAPN
ncbi:DNA topoisomerase 3-alpha-like [Senna tora]|uniref:DNA topoisomerase 3-alpha-like n=1 Tax=Senna tora TaxID=362788 RepID=A0A834WNJ7_9FABA|nr:DNA topoisomerase 3-alpha-like [Senna tora]